MLRNFKTVITEVIRERVKREREQPAQMYIYAVTYVYLPLKL